MFPFWEVAVAPVLEAAGARRLVEIGALRGENTRLMIERLGPETELHVIDPLPDFDPAVHEEEFGGQYVFHRDLSLNVLGELPPMDAALIDGDHNWYTVHNELRLLREVARRHEAPLPVMLLHDVGWPYGRRDLYYDPTNIPESFRKDWKRSGMEPGKVRLVPYGAGLNPTLANAKVEGGPRNGVMTAVDDFVREHDRPLRVVVLPIYFGLAIVVEEERLQRQPALAAELDRLESPEGKDQLLQLAEDVRIQALIFQHRIYYDRERSVTRLAQRYLGQVRDGLAHGAAERDALRVVEERLDGLRGTYVRGDVAVLGEAGIEAAFLGAYLEAYELTGRHLWVVGFGAPVDLGPLEQLDVVPDRMHVVEDLDDVERVAFAHLGPVLGADPGAVVAAVHARLAEGGIVMVAEDSSPDVLAAIDALAASGELTAVADDGRTWLRPDAGLAARTAMEGRHDQVSGL